MVGRINKFNSRARHWRQCANDYARDFSDPIDLADTRFARNVVALWKLGPRPVFELLSEIGGEFLIRVSVEKKVARFPIADRQKDVR